MKATTLSKADARRAIVAYHFQPGGLLATFERLRSVQYDPLRPVGSNHDLVLQSRVSGYRIGDWELFAYDKRKIYDGWDKQACLVPFSGWPARRIFHVWQGNWLKELERDHPHSVEAVLRELKKRGPLLPREFEFQERRDEWQGSWYGPNLTKHALRALWHAGLIMTSGRRGQHHVYDLTERVVPKRVFCAAPMTESESIRALLLDRHRAVGILRPTAPYEVWSMLRNRIAERNQAIRELVQTGDLVAVDVEGVSAHSTPEFLRTLDVRRRPVRVVFLAPLDQIVWDRGMLNHLFGFDYLWEVYKPEALRKWGYYVLPVMFGERFVGRFEASCRNRVLEIKCWHWEDSPPKAAAFWTALDIAMQRFSEYSGSGEAVSAPSVDKRVADMWSAACRSASPGYHQPVAAE